MNRLVPRLLAGLLLLALSLPAPVQAQAGPLGQHIVRQGETLYCLGRAYGVLPRAIAEANRLSATARLSVGQVLTIPAVRWERVPPGPVCVAQFASPYAQPGAPLPPTEPPAGAPPTATPAPLLPAARGDFQYVVQRGNTLYRIGLWFGTTVSALKAANGLTSDRIYPGQVLLVRNIACDPAYPTVCLPPSPPDLDCAQITAGEFAVLAPDPHRFDGDGDGVGCEELSVSDSSPSTGAIPLAPPVMPTFPPLPTPGSPPVCDPSYPDPGVCIPPPPPDLDCDQIPYRRFRVLAPDPHNFDGDGDGIGCEQ